MTTIMDLKAHALVRALSANQMKSVNTSAQWAYHTKKESKMNRMAST